MKTEWRFFGLLLLILTVNACKQPNEEIRSFYRNVPPGKTVQVRSMIGDQFVIESGIGGKTHLDTFSTSYDTYRDMSTIWNKETGDTLFRGFINKHEDMYFLSHVINDTAFHIYGIIQKGDSLYGWNTRLEQMHAVDSLVDTGDIDKWIHRTTPNTIELLSGVRSMEPYYREFIMNQNHLSIVRYKGLTSKSHGSDETIKGFTGEMHYQPEKKSMRIITHERNNYHIIVLNETGTKQHSMLVGILDMDYPLDALEPGTYTIAITNESNHLLTKQEIVIP